MNFPHIFQIQNLKRKRKTRIEKRKGKKTKKERKIGKRIRKRVLVKPRNLRIRRVTELKQKTLIKTVKGINPRNPSNPIVLILVETKTCLLVIKIKIQKETDGKKRRRKNLNKIGLHQRIVQQIVTVLSRMSLS